MVEIYGGKKFMEKDADSMVSAGIAQQTIEADDDDEEEDDE